MNSQNNRFSAEISEVSLDDVKVGVWYATSGTRVIGSVFFFAQDHKFTPVCYILVLSWNTCLVTKEPMPFSSKTVQQFTPQMVVYYLRVFGDNSKQRMLVSSFASYKTKQFLCLLKHRVNSNIPVSDGNVTKKAFRMWCPPHQQQNFDVE